MFKHITEKEQLRNVNIELAKLKSTVGELPKQEVEEIQKTLVGEIEQTKADVDYISIMIGVGL